MVNRLLSYEELIFAAQLKVRDLFYSYKEEPLPFHHFAHTEVVVTRSAEMAKALRMDEKDQAILLIAAWFIDTGYLERNGENREMKAADFAGAFLSSRDAAPELIASVRECIMAAKFPGNPQSTREKILCDAAYFHFGDENIKSVSKSLRKEDAVLHDKKIKKSEWRTLLISNLSQHSFFTSYAQNLLDKKKQQNLSLLKSKDEETENSDAVVSPVLPSTELVQEEEITTIVSTELKKKTTSREGPGRGVETMFRISSGNNHRLSDMADNKANIMITISSIIFSVVLSMLLQSLGDNTSLVFPTMILLAVCVTTIVFSILATRPALPKGVFSKEDIDEKKVNLLFFGNYYKMNYEDYQEGMNKMMKDNEFLYGSLTRDVYAQGIVLGRKYRLLRVAYNIFMFGIILSVLAFGISVIAII